MSRFLLLALLAFPAMVAARASPHQIEVISGDQGPQLRISGPWPNTCSPQLLPVFADGNTIEIAVRQSDQICGMAVTRYELNVDPRVAGGFGQAADGIYRVRFSVRDETSRATLLAFRLVDLDPSSARSALPEAGFWSPDVFGEFRPPNSGIGLMIERQGGTLALTTNAYLPGGQASWYLAAGPLTRTIFNGDLLLSTGGQPLWGASRTAQSVEPVGTLSLEFQSNASAIAWYARASDEGILSALELMPISLQRMNFALPADGAALAGTWSLLSTDPNSTRAPQTLRLEYRTDRLDTFTAVLNDSKSGQQLRCPIDSQRREAAPLSCELWKDGEIVARFDNNALARLSGSSVDGEPLVMVRIGD